VGKRCLLRFETALRYAALNTISVATTTGYATTGDGGLRTRFPDRVFSGSGNDQQCWSGFEPSPATTHAAPNDFQTWVCTLAMLLGRLELFTLLVVFTPVSRAMRPSAPLKAAVWEFGLWPELRMARQAHLSG
jgi:hypothetical protein